MRICFANDAEKIGIFSVRDRSFVQLNESYILNKSWVNDESCRKQELDEKMTTSSEGKVKVRRVIKEKKHSLSLYCVSTSI